MQKLRPFFLHHQKNSEKEIGGRDKKMVLVNERTPFRQQIESSSCSFMLNPSHIR